MLYPWPIDEANVILDEALDIALDYLEFTGQAVQFTHTQRICADTILAAWRRGTRHRIKLANYAIDAIEKKSPLKGDLPSLFPSVG